MLTPSTPGGSELSESAFGYFITACGVIILTIACYLGLPRLVSSWRTPGLGSRAGPGLQIKGVVGVKPGGGGDSGDSASESTFLVFPHLIGILPLLPATQARRARGAGDQAGPHQQRSEETEEAGVEDSLPSRGQHELRARMSCCSDARGERDQGWGEGSQ